MTNEEITEEIYHDAHKRGFINELRDELDLLRITHPKMDRYDRIHKAYHDIIKKLRLEPFSVD